MPECTALSDRMPAVAAGTDAWSALDLDHLAACSDCRTEWSLVQIAVCVGQGLPVPRDPAAVAGRVMGRLAAARTEQARARRSTWWAAGLAAAAIAAVVWTGRPAPSPESSVAGRVVESAAAGATSAALVPELDSLDAGELREVLDAFDAPLSERVIIGSPTLGDLSDQELERVLRAGGV